MRNFLPTLTLGLSVYAPAACIAIGHQATLILLPLHVLEVGGGAAAAAAFASAVRLAPDDQGFRENLEIARGLEAGDERGP